MDDQLKESSEASDAVVKLVLFSLFLFPIIGTFYFRSADINNITACLFSGFAASLFLCARVRNEARIVFDIRRHWWMFILLVFPLVWVLGGDIQSFWGRLLYILGTVLLFFYFSRPSFDSGEFFTSIVSAKALLLVVVSIYFLLFIYFVPAAEVIGRGVVGDPPLYHHLRHLNYDLFFAIPILVFLLNRKADSKLLVLICFLVASVAVWTAGRGMFLALIAALVLVKFRQIFAGQGVYTKTDVLCLLIFGSALFFIFYTGKAELIYGSAERTLDRDSINGISSNRLEIWRQSMLFFADLNTWSQLFGAGPDAFIRYRFWQGIAVHPHNAFVQILLEYGVIGFVLFCGYLIQLVRKCAILLFAQSTDVDALAVSLVLGGLVFSVVDGILYHATALITMLVLFAFVEARYVILTKKTSRVTAPVTRHMQGVS